MKTIIRASKVHTTEHDERNLLIGKEERIEMILSNQLHVSSAQYEGDILLTLGENEYLLSLDELASAVSGFVEASRIERDNRMVQTRLLQLNRYTK